MLVPTATKPQRGFDRPRERPNSLTVKRPAVIADQTKGIANIVFRPALVKLSLIPRNIIPIRSRVEVQNLSPAEHVWEIVDVFPIIAPIIIAIIIALIGLFENPSSFTPMNWDERCAAKAIRVESNTPKIHAGLIRMS